MAPAEFAGFRPRWPAPVTVCLHPQSARQDPSAPTVTRQGRGCGALSTAPGPPGLQHQKPGVGLRVCVLTNLLEQACPTRMRPRTAPNAPSTNP